VTLRSHHLAVLSTLAWGCGAPTRPPAAPAAAPDNVRAPDAVLAQLHPRSAERWTLRRADGSYVCTLPCAYWVRPDDELHLELEGSPGTLPTEKTAYELPRPLPANPGEQLTLTVDRQHGFGLMGKVVAAPLAVVLGLFGVTITTLATVSLATGSKHVTSRTSACASASTGPDPSAPQAGVEACSERTDRGVAADVGGLALGLGVLGLATLSTMWFFHDREGGLRFEGAAPTRAAVRVRVLPGAVGVEARGVSAWVTPLGVAGSF